MDFSAVSLGAASAVNQNYAALGSAIQAAGQNPNAATLASQTQSATPATFAVGVLKASLDAEASTGAQLAQMISQGPGIDIKA